MFKVELRNPEAFKSYPADNLAGASTFSDAYCLSQFAAATCTQPSKEKALKIAKHIDVKKALFDTGHHTTLQHSDHYLTFHIDNIPVSLVTFGLHLTHPFSNTSQCSGRYCTSMFETDDNSEIISYMRCFIIMNGSNVIFNNEKQKAVIDWVLKGIKFYKDNIERAKELVREAMLNERCHYPGDLDLQCRRIAQEQLRCVLSTIFPTRLVYTINITTLFSMYAVAWNTPMRSLLKQMIDSVPGDDIAKFAASISPSMNSYTPEFEQNVNHAEASIVSEPFVDVHFESMGGLAPRKLYDLYKSDSNNRVLDTLQFDPNVNPISTADSIIRVDVEVPVSTFGQDQRHRTIKRSNPIVTGSFYVPPIITKIEGAEDFCKQYMSEYLELCGDISTSDMIHFIPYGATVAYTKEADVRAYLHSANKRLCWSAEPTIAKMERETINQLLEDGLEEIDAPCLNDKCHEGKRYCGRPLKERTERELI